jgi:hypothetical protein
MRRELSLICAASVLAAGCGNQQSDPPDVTTPVRPVGSAPAFFDAQGVRIDVPGGWKVRSADSPPLVATVQSGTASVAVWRYPRTEKLPRTKAQLAQARDLLLAAARARDATFKQGNVAIRKSRGHPAIEVRGTETVSGQARTVRSLHVYAFGAEVVVDAFAPADVFARVDREAFRPLLRSVRVRAPKK